MMFLLAIDLFFAKLRVGCDCWRCAVEVDSRTDTQDAGELVFLCKGAREIPLGRNIGSSFHLLDSAFGGVDLPAVYILSAVRTPIGKFGGTLASQTAAGL